MTEKETKGVSSRRYRKRVITSFQLGNLVGLMLAQLWSSQLETYYKDVVALDYSLILIAIGFYTIFNMINDPLIGYLCDRSKRFTSKWGKRFPYIVMGAIPYSFMVIFIFMAPSVSQVGQLGSFIWLIIFYCLTDTFFSLFDVNRTALFPDKFRDNNDRKIAGALTAVLETFGILLGVVLPALIISDRYNSNDWTIMAVVAAIISILFILMMIPGVREGPELRERRTRLDQEIKSESFIAGIKIAMKDQNFVAFTVFYTAYTSAMGVVMVSLPHYVEDILQLPKSGELILAFYIIAVIISAPIWFYAFKKLGIKKVAIIGASLLASCLIPVGLIPMGSSGTAPTIVVLMIVGFFDGAIISSNIQLFSRLIDKATVISGKRMEGMYQGTYVFISRIGIFIRFFVAWLIVQIFGYESGVTTPTALLGLRIQISVIPCIIFLIGIIILWKLYDITLEQSKVNTLKLQELNL